MSRTKRQWADNRRQAVCLLTGKSMQIKGIKELSISNKGGVSAAANRLINDPIACVQTITKLWLVPSAKQRRDPCSGPPTDSTNYRKCVSNFPSTWLAITTNKTKAFFNWPIVARTQIWVHSWKSRTRISALFHRRS